MKNLQRTMMIALACLVMAFSGFSGSAEAAAASGVSSAGEAISSAIAGTVHKTHGCHRHPVVGPWTGILHRHVGPNCVWQQVHRRGNVCKRWRHRCRERCYGAPHPKRCRIRCFENNAPGFCF